MFLDDETTFLGVWYGGGIFSIGFPLILFLNQ